MSDAAPVRLAIADDNPVLRFGLRAMLEAVPDIKIVAEAMNGEEAVGQVHTHRPDVLLLDLVMPVMDGLSAIPQISDLTRVVVLTCVVDPATVVRAIAAGARGYIVHGQFEIRMLGEIVRKTAQGGSPLSPAAAKALVNGFQQMNGHGTEHRDGILTRREREIMDLIAEGLSNRQIAARLVLSEKTVKNHICKIYDALRVTGRSQAVSRWRQVRSAPPVLGRPDFPSLPIGHFPYDSAMTCGDGPVQLVTQMYEASHKGGRPLVSRAVKAAPTRVESLLGTADTPPA